MKFITKVVGYFLQFLKRKNVYCLRPIFIIRKEKRKTNELFIIVAIHYLQSKRGEKKKKNRLLLMKGKNENLVAACYDH